jgi:hypothetical protein
MNNLRRLDASDCADIIRFAGAWVENGGLIGAGATGSSTDAWGQNLSNSEAIKDAFRPGVQTGRGDWRNEVESTWSDGKGRFDQPDLTKRRDRGPGWKIEPHLVDLMRDPKGFSGMAGIGAGCKGSKRAQGESNVLKLDRLFGLVTACDISGTTTDTAFALEVWGGGIVSAGYYLVPFGTIAHNMHHSLLEVALALSINHIIDYRIGFFETMLPTKNLPAELNQIAAILAGTQQRMRNWGLHFICYYQNNQVAGCYQFSGADVDRLYNSEVSRATTMLDKAQALSAYPSKAEVDDLMQWVH